MDDSAKKYLQRRSKDLKLERAEFLHRAQVQLDSLYKGAYQAQSLNGGTLKITTKSAAAAGELRLRQQEIIAHLKKVSLDIERLQIIIS